MIRFFFTPEPTGKTVGGVPEFKNVLMIEVARSTHAKVTIPAKAKHIEAHRGAYDAFMERNAALANLDGFPISVAPFASPADRAMCEAAGILTVEDAATADLSKAPAAMADLADRARIFLEAVQGTDAEAAGTIDAQREEIAALKDELAEAQAAAKAARAEAAKATKAPAKAGA